MVRKRPSSCRLEGGSSSRAVTPLLPVCTLGSVQAVLSWAAEQARAGGWILGWEGGRVCRACPEQAGAARWGGIQCCPSCMARDNGAGSVAQGRYEVWRRAVARQSACEGCWEADTPAVVH